MKVKIFEVILHKLPTGKSPATALEEQLNAFLAEFPNLQLVTSHMSTLVAPAEPNAMPSSTESSIILFCTLFYRDASAQYMDTLKRICLTFYQLLKQIGSLPQTIAAALKARQRQAARNAFEVDRLDRIRNPSKYRGKD